MRHDKPNNVKEKIKNYLCMECQAVAKAPIKSLTWIVVLSVSIVLIASMLHMVSLDARFIDVAESQYDSLGTIYNKYSAWYSEMDPVPEEAIETLVESGLVKKMNNFSTRSCLVEGLERAPCTRGFPVADTMVFCRGVVMGRDIESFDVFKHDNIRFYVQVDRLFGAYDYGNARIHNQCVIWQTDDVSKYDYIEEGGEYLFLGRVAGQDDNISYTISVIPDQMSREIVGVPASMIGTDAIIAIPEDLDEEQKDAWCESVIREKGIGSVLYIQTNYANVFSLHETADMQMHKLVRSHQVFATGGRFLSPEDIGKKVCVISDKVAYKNGLSVGDTIRISKSDTVFEIGQFESGIPGCSDYEDIEFEASEEYEIIGTYGAYLYEHSLAYGLNDIFIPYGEEKVNYIEYDNCSPYTFTFSVEGHKTKSFLSKVNSAIDNLNCAVSMDLKKWEVVAEQFEETESRIKYTRIIMCASIVIFALLYGVMAFIFYRRELALHYLMSDGRLHHTIALFMPLASVLPVVIVASWFGLKKLSEYYMKYAYTEALGIENNQVLGLEGAFAIACIVVVLIGAIAVYTINRYCRRHMLEVLGEV